MEKIYYFFMFVIFIFSSCNQFEKEIDSIISEESFNGSVLIAEGDEILYSKGIGYADFEQKIPNEVSTKFLIGSISKQFTATCIMLLQEDGLLKITDPITDYLNYPTEEEITIENLLCHTSGLPEFLPNHLDLPIIPFMENNLSFDDFILSLPPKNKNSPKVGESFEYRNSNYFFLGLIIERVSGMSYNEFLENKIFKPLDMVNTGARIDFYDLDKTAIGYKEIKDTHYTKAYRENLLEVHGTGDIYSTVDDLYKWYLAISSDFLSEKSKQSMFNSRLDNYGLGWFVVENNDVIYHGGDISGYFAHMVAKFSEDKVIIVLSNFYDEIPIDNVFWRSCEKLKIQL